MKRIYTLCALLVLAMTPQLTFGSEDEARSEFRVAAEELYRLSGLEIQADDIGSEILAGFKNSGVALPDNVNRVIADVIRTEFADEILRERAINIIVDSWNVDFADGSRIWLISEAGRQIINIEENASTDAGMAGLEVYIAELEENPPSESRDALINNLDAAYGGTDFVVDITLAIGLAVAIGINAVSPEYEQLDILELNDHAGVVQL